MLSSIVLLPLIAGPASLIARPYLRNASAWALAAIPLLLFLRLFLQLGTLAAGAAIVEVDPWIASQQIELSFVLDALGLLLALIITGVGSVVLIYSGYDMANEQRDGLFLCYLLVLLGSMLGVVLAGNLFTLILFWHLTAWMAYLLLGSRHEDIRTRYSSQQALLLLMGGALSLLNGLLCLSQAAQSIGLTAAQSATFAALVATGDQIRNSALYAPAVLLITAGCFVMSAQVPLHFWLLNSIQSPTPASTYLSAVMSLLGVYLLARLSPALSGSLLWHYLLLLVGGSSFLFGAALALRQQDMKLLLTYGTISQSGSMVLLIGLAGRYAHAALTATMLNHALSIGALFLLVGAVSRTTGTWNIRRLGQLRHAMPITTWLAVLAALSLAGVPLFLGFLSTGMLYRAAFDPGTPLLDIERFVVVSIGVGGTALSIAYLWHLIYRVFAGSQRIQVRRAIREAPAGMLIGPALLASLALVCGLPGIGLIAVVNALTIPAASLIAGTPLVVELALWQGPWGPLLCTILALALGAMLIFYHARVTALFARLPLKARASQFYDATLDGLHRSANLLTRAIQGGKLRTYISTIMFVWLGLVGTAFLVFGLQAATLPPLAELTSTDMIAGALIALLMPSGVLVALETHSRLEALIATGATGAVMALFFILAGGPDLALLQLLASLLGSIFMLLLYALLPARSELRSSQGRRIMDALTAAAFGLLLAGLTFISASGNQFAAISSFAFLQNVPQGQGEHVVNLLLTDFRGLDTLGAVVVLFLVMLGVYSLLRLRRSPRPQEQEHSEPG